MSLLTHLNPNAIEDASIEGIKLKDGSITSSKIDSSVASKKYVDDTIASAISASDAMVFKGTIGTGGTSESLPSTAIVGDTYKVIESTVIPGASSYTGAEETAKVGDLTVAISGEPKWVVVPSGDDEIKTLVQSITWSDLKAKRDAGGLIPGMQYRITDYACTTTQTDTKSAGHQFDIIVVADDESTLNETARAIKHPVAEGETDYFANNDLSVWQIWYCLDNDTMRFAWADSTNGKGVIYRMIDEFNNDIPYDFKNIQFKHPLKSSTYPYYYYTFYSSTSENNTDYSLSISNRCYSNTIREYISSNKRTLNNILFMGINCYGNSFGLNCYNNCFGNSSYFNSFGSECYGNVFEYNCYHNSFGSNCYNNTFSSNCSYNSFGNYCCYNNTGYYFQYNSFKNDCQSNSFDYNCGHNSFGNYCKYNIFGYNCEYNSFGDYCQSNHLGNVCRCNSFGHSNTYIVFTIAYNSSDKYSFYSNNHFGDGCQFIIFTGKETASATVIVQNYNFAQGLQGTSGTYLTIDGVRNRTFETKVAQNSNGELKVYCEADLIR